MPFNLACTFNELNPIIPAAGQPMLLTTKASVYVVIRHEKSPGSKLPVLASCLIGWRKTNENKKTRKAK